MEDEIDDNKLRIRTLPVSLVARIPRHALYPSIDSLSVYQYLNRGTCRPFWRINGPTGADIDDAIIRDQAVPAYAGTLSEETAYAAFARSYLNDIIRVFARTGVEGHPPGLHACRDEVDFEALALNTMNPILVETAALLFCQDLGLCPDIGVGKGMDVLDVRARATSVDGVRCLKTASSAADLLHAVLKTGGGSPDEAVSHLRRHGVLDVQCKAAQRGQALPGILYFGFFNEKRKRKPDTLFLPSLAGVLSDPRFAGDFQNLRAGDRTPWGSMKADNQR